jgi:hypothetical protein
MGPDPCDTPKNAPVTRVDASGPDVGNEILNLQLSVSWRAGGGLCWVCGCSADVAPAANTVVVAFCRACDILWGKTGGINISAPRVDLLFTASMRDDIDEVKVSSLRLRHWVAYAARALAHTKPQWADVRSATLGTRPWKCSGTPRPVLELLLVEVALDLCEQLDSDRSNFGGGAGVESCVMSRRAPATDDEGSAGATSRGTCCMCE